MTANGERMNPSAMTAAHKSLPFGTRIKVVNKSNGKSVVVRINDRGPFIRGRIVDLSKAAAKSIGMIQSGHAKVCYTRILEQNLGLVTPVQADVGDEGLPGIRRGGEGFVHSSACKPTSQ